MNSTSYPEMALFILRPSVRIFHSFIPSFNLLLSCFFGDRRVEFLVNGPIVAHFFFTAPVAYCQTCQISSPHCSCLNTAWTVDRCIDNICLSRSFMRSLAYPAERFFSLKKAFTQIPPYKYRLLFEKTTYFS